MDAFTITEMLYLVVNPFCDLVCGPFSYLYLCQPRDWDSSSHMVVFD